MPDVKVSNSEDWNCANLFGLQLDGVRIVGVYRTNSPKDLSYVPIRLQSGEMEVLTRVQGGYDLFPKYPDDLDREKFALGIIETATSLQITVWDTLIRYAPRAEEDPKFKEGEQTQEDIPTHTRVVDVWATQDGPIHHLVRMSCPMREPRSFEQLKVWPPTSLETFEMLPRTPGDEFLG